MELQQIQKDRFLRKDPNQTDQTKSAIYTAANPAPKRGDDLFRKLGRPKGSEEDDGAPNILTGTVIISCFIQTSALPSRIEMAGNDLTFFDDTYSQGGRVIGDTSRLVFTHGSAKDAEVIEHGFIMEKRASTFNTYDNVLSWFAMPADEGAHNYMFIGRDAFGDNSERNMHSVHFAVDYDSGFTPANNNPLNGVWEVEYSEDGVYQGRLIFTGASASLFPGAGLSGFSAAIIGGQGGLVGLGYDSGGGAVSIALYMLDATAIQLGADLIPDVDSFYDIGTNSMRIATIYADAIVVTSLTITTLNATTVNADEVNVDTLIHLGPQATNYTSPGDLWYYDSGVEGLRMRISGGFTLQFDATIV